ncbi:MAG: hypothetical protein PHO07_13640 [Pirellulales bacterium]|jgi:endogenous inhibitor of DNA gyrase (YacG/DUF329 family)|nr:hypothetical protein [Thermoguttaceae bacterium]MDD4788211.1 hypothetical protein [Pirellulales bacterium]NLY99324.1 hypothetical protein [Pirellulaceae bacterium]
MIATLMRYRCPFCSQMIVQIAGHLGPSVCPRCLRTVASEESQPALPIPIWVWGVVVVLAGRLLVR